MSLSTDAELHEVIDSDASGIFRLINVGSTYRYTLRVTGLSGPATGAHIHGPATDAQNGPVMATLCGGPAPTPSATCTMAGNTLIVTGELAGLVGGLPLEDFVADLDGGLTYVNVHTALNPAGEARGQIVGN